MLQPMTTPPDELVVEDAASKSFDISLIVMILMLMSYFVFETFKHQVKLPIGHETAFVLLLGFLVY
jgi:hypothetical protein